MNFDQMSLEFGKLVKGQDDIKSSLLGVKQDTKALLAFQSATEERLRQGAGTFAEHKKLIKAQAEELNRIEQKIPSKRWLYSIIFLGFTALAALVKL